MLTYDDAYLKRTQHRSGCSRVQEGKIYTCALEPLPRMELVVTDEQSARQVREQILRRQIGTPHPRYQSLVGMAIAFCRAGQRVRWETPETLITEISLLRDGKRDQPGHHIRAIREVCDVMFITDIRPVERVYPEHVRFLRRSYTGFQLWEGD